VTRRVLVVEDDDDLRDILKIVLREEGLEVHTCVNGQEALDYLEANRAPEKRPSIILLDLNMPVLDGWKVSEWLHKDPDLGSIPLAVISATQQQGEQVKALYADAYIVKPFTTDEILGIVGLFSLLHP
jgi:CheY-like chemotaxis protein